MNEYQQEKYRKQLSKMPETLLQKEVNKINLKIANCLTANKRKQLKQYRQQKHIIEW